MFFEHFEKICIENGTTPTALVKSLNLSSSKVTAWKSGSLPKEDVILLLAKALDVTPAQFWDGASVQTMSDECSELIGVFEQLNRPARMQILGRTYELLEAQKQKESPRAFGAKDA